jgi:hypothetical protein
MKDEEVICVKNVKTIWKRENHLIIYGDFVRYIVPQQLSGMSFGISLEQAS